jgi:hypothetical protein
MSHYKCAISSTALLVETHAYVGLAFLSFCDMYCRNISIKPQESILESTKCLIIQF